MQNFKAWWMVIVAALTINGIHAQADTLNKPEDSLSSFKDTMVYDAGNGRKLVYSKPKKFAFILNLPRDAAGIASASVQKESIKPWLAVAGSTGVLLLADRAIVNGVRNLSNNIHLTPAEKNYNVTVPFGGKEVALLRFPANVNTALYQIGQGFPGLVLGAGLFTYGKITKDYRSLSTARQLAESFILMGVGTQILKRITGRQNPSETSSRIGKWQFFPSFSQFQKHQPNYDAFPSGHLATLMSSVTIFAENYPEKKWIKPIGYSVTALVGYAMINNQVHWASDYPLALALGYLCAKQVAIRSRVVESRPYSSKRTGQLNCTFTYLNRTFMPGIVYNF